MRRFPLSLKVVGSSLIIFLLLSAHVSAQTDWTPPPPPGAQALANSDELVQTIGTASQEIMLASPLLRSREVAEAVRVAVVERGVSTFILAPAEGLEDQGSYFMSLALAGAAVSSAPVDEPFIVIDRTILLLGPMLSGGAVLPGKGAGQTYYFDSPDRAAPFVESFYKSYSEAAPYDPETFVNELSESTTQETEEP